MIFVHSFIDIYKLILKRWKRIKTKYKMLRKYGLDHKSAMKIANSRKKYWRLSSTHEVHRALTTKRLYKWGLEPLTQLAETAYARY
ncbi:reverse transcriptase [Staphylococcus simiae]|nr:reverse transcriptase [Staphylococcus simiae]